MVMEVRIFSLGAGKDTVVFAANAAANGEDEITGFTAGTDKLNFKAANSSATSSKVISLGATGSAQAATDKGAIIVVSTATDSVTSLTKGTTYVVGVVQADDSTNFYYYTATGTTASADELKGLTDGLVAVVGATVVASDFVSS